ncbi:hypothetical protein [Paraburkholderia humisilvae]|uniref:Uncharacterized protein n=1 Tax=Paraburkholderia humisilvae TaxID=627669 RepID=A0A6J5DIJ2_9BURK|nr:hypothetical protein [Paraburkholderia humisilvae]CAB3754009.1 hypothetical protein LMG29542_02219 [Paraburkholderia humisilvae]
MSITRKSFSLQQIIYRLIGAANQEARAALESEPDKPGRFPVQVRPDTRAFLEAYAKTWGGSIASVAGAILDGVAMTQMHGAEAAMRGTVERLSLLIEEHDLSYPAAAEILTRFGITLADLSSPDALRGKLTAPRLESIAQEFCVKYDWLAGKSSTMTSGELHMWYKAADKAAEILWTGKHSGEDVKLILVTGASSNLEAKTEDGLAARHMPHVLPVIERRRALPGGEFFTRYELWEEGRWSYWRARHYLKLVVFFAQKCHIHVIGYRIDDDAYDHLVAGKVLCGSLFKHRNVTWYPDDYVPYAGRPPAKDPQEWATIESSDDYHWTFRRFNEILSEMPTLSADQT